MLRAMNDIWLQCTCIITQIKSCNCNPNFFNFLEICFCIPSFFLWIFSWNIQKTINSLSSLFFGMSRKFWPLLKYIYIISTSTRVWNLLWKDSSLLYMKYRSEAKLINKKSAIMNFTIYLDNITRMIIFYLAKSAYGTQI